MLARVLIFIGLLAPPLAGCGVEKIHTRLDAGRESGSEAPANDAVGSDGAAADTVPRDDSRPEIDAGGESDGAGGDDDATGGDAADATGGSDAGDAGAVMDAAADRSPDGTGGASGSGGSGGAGGDGTCTTCATWGSPQALGAVPPVLPELSGLAASWRHPGLVYAHNDSGDSAHFFALDLTAKPVAEIQLAGATATDWEAISVGPCPSGSCVYVGDVGDNNRDRAQYVIYRLAEPVTLPSNGSAVAVSSYEQLPFVYPDGPHNAETVMVHPTTGQVFVITKENKEHVAPLVYELPLPLTPGQQATLRPVTTMMMTIDQGYVTDGAFHPCGDRMLIRTTTALFQMARPAGGAVASIFSATPSSMPVAAEPQGEAVTWALDGARYYTSSETVDAKAVPSLSAVVCATP